MGTNSKVANRCDNCGSKQPTHNSKCSFCLVENVGDERSMREGFDKRVAENPQDSTVHHQYADYLEEQGHNDEAHEHRRLAYALEGSTSRELGLTPHLAWRRGIEASKKANTETQAVPSTTYRGDRGSGRSHIASRNILAWARGDRNEMTGERDRPSHESISAAHSRLAMLHEQAGHTDAAKAHRIAALAHLVAHHVNWGSAEQAAARDARAASARAHIQEEAADNQRMYRGDVEPHSWVAMDAANRAARPQGTLAAHRSAINSHEEAMGQGSAYPEMHREAIEAHKEALKLKNRKK